MDYKSIIKNKEVRFKILHLLKIIPDKLLLKLQYKIKLGRTLNIKHPKRYTEKIQWYKINYRDQLMTQCCDKYMVRKYIESKGLEHILNKNYGVYKSFDEIKLDLLPNKFVIKTTNGSGTNLFCKDKKTFDINNYKKEINSWLNRDIFSLAREWAYKDIKPQIIIEEYLEDKSNNYDGVNDYKIICFYGEPKFIILDVDRYVNHRRNIYDIDWNLIKVITDHSNIDDEIKKPDGLEDMIRIARVLSKDFPCVRVDLYYLNKRIYFGELTFYPWSGYVQFTPDDFDIKLGNEFKLPEKKK